MSNFTKYLVYRRGLAKLNQIIDALDVDQNNNAHNRPTNEAYLLVMVDGKGQDITL